MIFQTIEPGLFALLIFLMGVLSLLVFGSRRRVGQLKQSSAEIHQEEKRVFDFLHELDVTYLHVFTYSERDNTKALEIKPVVPVNIRNERNKVLRNLSYKKQQYFNEQHAGETRKVLFEIFEKNGMMEGYTDNYIRVTTPYRTEWANKQVDWTLQ